VLRPGAVLLSHLNHTGSVSYEQVNSHTQVSAAQKSGMAPRIIISGKSWQENNIDLICEIGLNG
jgi:hypothetical protein